MVDYQPIMPKVDKTEAKELAQPTELSQPIPAKKILQEKEETKLPKAMYQLVSISVTESIPLKNVFIELARQAGVDLQLDHTIDAKIIFTAQKRPFIEVIKSMCAMSNLRFDVVDTSLRIERDTPYSKNYNVQFLNLSRSSENQVSVATDVFSNGVSPAKAGNGDNVSKSALKATTKNDFWDELEHNLKTIVEDAAEKGSYSVHRQAGLVSLRANRKQHLQVEQYLEQLRLVACSQVLIEAKIIEVTLKDEYRSGINWQKVGNKGDLEIKAPFGDMATKSSFLDSTAQANMISFGASGSKFSGIANVLQEFGLVRTLSSPRITVMNNQSAILKVAQNKVYFRLNYDKMYNSQNNAQSTTVSSDIQTVPIGLLMMVQPSIDPKTGEIILFLRPSISRLTQSIADPAIDIAYNAGNTTGTVTAAPVQSMIPVVEVREIDSVLRLNNKEMAILGGLMEVRSAEHKQNIPGLGDVPLLRDLTGSIAEGDSIVELVIVLKATIMDNGAAPDGADQRLMNKYTADPRPLK